MLGNLWKNSSAVVLASCLLATAAPTDAAILALQGRLTSAAGGPVADGNYPMQISLYAQAVGGDALFNEKFLNVVVSGGAFALTLGEFDPKSPLDDSLFVGYQAKFIGIQAAGDPELARVALRSVPFAVEAQHAAMAGDLQCSQCVGDADIAASAVTSDKIAAGAVKAQHVDFAYAGSAAKGGAATEAVHAATADTAKTADNATNAGNAATADSAKKADTATAADEAKVAKILQCSGCVTNAMLAAEVADGIKAKYVQKSGDAMAGQLVTDGGVHFKSSKLFGFRFENAAVAPVICDATQAGYAYFDTVSKSLVLCDGTKFKALSNKLALGSDKSAPAPSCLAILQAGDSKGDADYWIDLDGGDPSNAAQLTCNMADGGWTRINADDFEGNANGWNQNVVTTCGPLGKILGGFNVMAGGQMTKTLNVSAATHTQMKISLDYVSIDSSDGEQGWIVVDGAKVWTHVLDNCVIQVGSNYCGAGGPPCFGDVVYKAAAAIAHNAANVTFGGGSSLDQGAGDESFGIDNVIVWIK